ncbi:hypothetical protein Tco_0693947 [Tanacetum coccineum]
MDDPNITMEEYIRLEEEKAQKCRKVFNWETAKYVKIWYDEDVHDLRSVETKFPTIVFNDNFKSNETLSCEPTISSLNNNEIDFRISFNESDDEDYTDTKIPQSSGPPAKVGDEIVHKELGDRMERAATTTSSLEAKQDSGNISRTQSMATLNEPNP